MLAWGPHRIGWRLGIARSTVYAVLRRAGLHRLAWLHRTTREIVRYEHARPGALVHLDIKKLGRIPQGGGKRILPGFAETHSGPQRGPRLGFDFLHVAVDDHSRYAYVEALPDERGPTAAAFLVRALAHFERQGIAVERILTDNGACYVSRIFTDTAAARNIRLKRTRPFRPQTNGKAEAFNKIMQAEWAYQRPYYSNDERLNVLPGFLAYYNHRRPHGGIGGATPASRLSTTSLGTTPRGRANRNLGEKGEPLFHVACAQDCCCCGDPRRGRRRRHHSAAGGPSPASRRFFSLGNALAGGIFLGAGFIHLLLDAGEVLEGVVAYPLAPLLAAVVVVVVLLLIDRVLFETSHTSGAAQGGGTTQPIYPVVLLVVLSF